MTETAPAANQAGNPATPITSAERVALNRQLAQMLKGGVIMDVTTPEQARIAEGATMIRTKGEPGTGDVVQAVRHMRRMNAEIRRIQNLRDDELFEAAKELQVPVELLREVHEAGKLPVVNFAAGGIATPADAALMMQLGAEGVFVGSGIFKSGDPARRAEAIVKATTNFNDPEMLAALSEDLGEAMVGINEQEIQIIMEERGQ